MNIKRFAIFSTAAACVLSAAACTMSADDGRRPAPSPPVQAGAMAQTDGGPVIRVSDEQGHVLRVQLNSSPAAQSLYAQLPLTVDVENYSNNEKIFYPPQSLATEQSPLASPGTGVVAYYRPWGDVVFFYGPFRENDKLFSLGQVTEGTEQVPELTGTIYLERSEAAEGDIS